MAENTITITREAWGSLGLAIGDAKTRHIITRVVDGGPAFAAGVRAGDLLVKVDGVPMGNKLHDQVILALKADEESTSITLTLKQDVHRTPAAWELIAAKLARAEGGSLGLSVGDGTVGAEYQVVTAVVADSAAAKAGVQQGDVLLAIDNKVATKKTQAEVIAQLKGAGADATFMFGRPLASADFAVKSSDITPLSNDAKFPSVGLGTWKAGPGEVQQAVFTAIQRGYRHIDGACDYGNEQEVGLGIRFAMDLRIVTRADLWVTSKLWNTYHAQDKVEPACRRTLTDLGLDYVDLYLIHFPISTQFVPFEDAYPPEWTVPGTETMVPINVPLARTWAGMETLVAKGMAKNIGLSNYSTQLISDLLSYCKVKPTVLQVEIHPHNQQEKLVSFCNLKGIKVTGFSPLGAKSYSWLDGDVQVAVFDEPILKRIAKAHKKSVAQVCIRWQVQRGLTVVPKSCNPGRLSENLDVFSFELTEQDMKDIATINKDRRYNDPGDFCKGFGLEHGYPIY